MNAEQIELVYAIKNCIDKEKEISEKLALGNKAINLLTNKMIVDKKYNFPTNFSEFIKFIKTENMNTYLGDDLPSEPFVNYRLEINEYIVKKTDEKDATEKVQKIMKKLLDYCRNRYKEDGDVYWDNEYRIARTFISDTYLIEKSNLDKKLYSIFSDETLNIIKDMYESVELPDSEIIVCPVCGRQLDFTNEKGSCQEVCKYYRTKYNLKNVTKKINPKNKFVKLNEGIYKFVLLPNIGEIKMYKKLSKKFEDLDVVLYPNIDEFDISISNGDVCINLDVKDHKTPGILVNTLRDNSNLYKFNQYKHNYLVIPDHRVDMYKKNHSKNYMKELNALLQKEEFSISLIQEKNLIKQIEQILGVLYE